MVYSVDTNFTTTNENECADNVFTGFRILNTQADVNEFGSNGYCKILGTLFIGDEVPSTIDPIVDLRPLSSIRKVGSLSIWATSLIDLNDLNISIIDVEGYIQIYNNFDLLSIEKLKTASIRSHLVQVVNNPSLTSLNGLQGLTGFRGSFRSGELDISYNNSLLSLEGLDNLRFFNDQGGFIKISNNGSLRDINSLSNLISIEGENAIDVSVYNNLILENLQGFSGLKSCSAIYIENNSALINLSGLDNLMSSENIQFTNNILLSDLCAITPLISGGGQTGNYTVNNNAYNPTQQDIIDGNCRL